MADSQKGEEKELTFTVPKLDFLKNIEFKRIINAKTLLFLLLILIPIIITIGVRIQPIQLELTEDWARSSVYTNLRNQLQSSIDANYPTMSQAAKQELVDTQFNEYLRTNKAAIEIQIKQAADYFKTAFQYTENGNTYTYLGDLDSYYYLRQARNIIDHGNICDMIESGKCMDSLMLAPTGVPVEDTLHPHAIVFTYKILHFFDKNLNLMYASFYLPTIIAVLVSILSFLVARKIAGNIGGFFAAVFISTSQIFLTRTLGSDTDIWNIFFPLLLLFLFIQTVESKRFVHKLIWAAAAGIAFGLYSFAWVAWWFTFDLVVLTYLLFLFYLALQTLLKHRSEPRQLLLDARFRQEVLTLLVIVLLSGISVSLISSFSSFITSPFQPLHMTSIDDASFSTLWPNVYTTVAELNNSSLAQVVSTLGGKLIFFLICLGIILALFTKDIKNKEFGVLAISAIIYFLLVQDAFISLGIIPYLLLFSLPLLIGLLLVFKDSNVEIKYSLLLLVWMAASLYAALKGMRFVLLVIPVAGVSFGVAIERLHKIFRGIIVSSLKLDKTVVSIAIFLIFCMLLVAPVKGAYSTGKSFLPSISSTWAGSLTNIRDNTEPDSILTSWWDFGHWFKYFADRRVTFDGASQNIPQAHWVGKALLSDDEKVSVGILRMLSCGGNSAYELMNAELNDSLLSIKLLNQIIVEDKESARQTLKGHIANDDKITQVLDKTHCEPSPDYFITSDDMVQKSGVWAHFGAWDFDKAYIYNNLRGKQKAEAMPLIEKMGYSEEDALRLFDEATTLQDQASINSWLAPWPGYLTDGFTSCQKEANTLTCAYNIVLTQDSSTAVVLESAVIYLDNINSSYVQLGYIERSSGKKTAEARATPNAFALTEEKDIVRYNTARGGQTLGFDVLVDTTNSRTLLLDPLLTGSLFTKLYYLDGRYAPSFQKFSDDWSNILGHRIAVWKVLW